MVFEVFNGGFYFKEVDLWLFGCVLYEMFMGEQFFVVDFFLEFVLKIFKEDFLYFRLKIDVVINDGLREFDSLI